MGKMERSTDDGAVSADGEVAKEVSSRRTSSNAWCMAGCEADRHVRPVEEVQADIDASWAELDALLAQA